MLFHTYIYNIIVTKFLTFLDFTGMASTISLKTNDWGQHRASAAACL